MLLDGVRVVLVNTRFPENVGMAVRACANMGCSELTLVTPEMWIPEKAAPLATAKGAPLLSRVKVVSSLAEAIGDCHLILATTARTGGWRKALQSPGEAACDVARSLAGGERVAIVFGNESRGLENSQIELCQRIVTIPTSGEASSLNLAQSVLILLYECAGAVRRMQRTGSPEPAAVSRSAPASPEREEEKGEGGPAVITGEDEERLMEALKDALLRLDVLHGDNPDYFSHALAPLFRESPPQTQRVCGVYGALPADPVESSKIILTIITNKVICCHRGRKTSPDMKFV